MKRIILAMSLALLFCFSALGQTEKNNGGKMKDSSVKASLVALEKQAWEAWKSKNADFFRTYLAADAISNGRNGVERKDQIVGGVADSKCEVKSYSFDESSFAVTMIDSDAAMLTYKAMQDYTCNGKPGPTPVWATAMYVKRGGKWQNMFYQETQAEK